MSNAGDFGDNVIAVLAKAGNPARIEKLSMLFDPIWRRAGRPGDIRNPVELSTNTGWRLGHNPDPLFDVRCGASQGRRPRADG